MSAGNPWTIRRPAVAGYYYPADPAALRRAIDACVWATTRLSGVKAVVLPHDSLPRAGAVIGQTLSRVTVPRRCVIVGASHTVAWVTWQIMGCGAYRTPLGDVPVDQTAVDALQRRCPFLEVDGATHRGEHSIEVLVPFLQQMGPEDLSIVPLIAGSDDPAACAEMAQALAQLVLMQEEPVLLIASSNLSHYLPQLEAAKRDQRLLQAMAAFDAGYVLRQGGAAPTLMCGAAAAACVLEAARRLGATRADVVAQGHSAQAGGDPDAVIGYGGVIVT